MDAINIFEQIRRTLAGLMKLYSEEQMMIIPDGFDNNIAWNFAHIAVVQEGLTYRLSGAPTVTTEKHRAMFNINTSPADWNETPDIGEIRELLKTTGKKLRADYEAGVFADFRPYTTSTGFHLATIEEAIAFVNFHEGLHLGFILSLGNFVRS